MRTGKLGKSASCGVFTGSQFGSNKSTEYDDRISYHLDQFVLSAAVLVMVNQVLAEGLEMPRRLRAGSRGKRGRSCRVNASDRREVAPGMFRWNLPSSPVNVQQSQTPHLTLHDEVDYRTTKLLPACTQDQMSICPPPNSIFRHHSSSTELSQLLAAETMFPPATSTQS